MAIIQAVALPVNGTYPSTTAFPSPVTVGSRILVVFLHTYAGCVPSCSDNLGNVYTFRGTQLQNGTGHYLEVFEALVTVGGSCTPAPTAGCGGLRLGVILEVSGLDPTTPYDGENDIRNTASPIGCGGVTTTQPGDLLIGLFVPSNTGIVPTITMTDGSTDLVLPGGARGEKIVSRFAGAAGATDITATATGPVLATDPIDGYMVAFIALPSAVGPVVGFGGTRRRPGRRGPYDRRGFLKARVWEYSMTPALPQAAAPAPAISTWVTLAAAVTLGAVSITPAPAISTWVVPSPGVTLGAVAVTPSPAIWSWVVPAPAITLGAVSVSPSPATASWVVPAPAMTLGAIGVAPAVAVRTWSVPAPAITLAVTVAPAPAVSTWVVPAPSASVGLPANPAPAVCTWVVPGPSVTVGAIGVTPAPAVRGWVTPSPAISVGAVALAPSAAASAWVVRAPAVTLGSPLATLVGTFTQLLPRAELALATPPVTLALRVIPATLSLATPPVTLARTGPRPPLVSSST